MGKLIYLFLLFLHCKSVPYMCQWTYEMLSKQRFSYFEHSRVA